jgi:hypothetical protein
MLQSDRNHFDIFMCSEREQRVTVDKLDVDIFKVMLARRFCELQTVKEEIDKV